MRVRDLSSNPRPRMTLSDFKISKVASVFALYKLGGGKTAKCIR